MGEVCRGTITRTWAGAAGTAVRAARATRPTRTSLPPHRTDGFAAAAVLVRSVSGTAQRAARAATASCRAACR